MESKEKPILSVRMNAELLARVDALCERTGVGRAEIIERCLIVGLDDEEQFVQWLESPLRGPWIGLLTHPKVLEALVKVIPGWQVSQTQQKVRKNVTAKRRESNKLRPRTA